MLEAASFAADISQQPEGAVIPEMPGYMRVREQGFPTRRRRSRIQPRMATVMRAR